MKQFSGLWPNIVGRAAADNALLERLVKDAQPVLQAAVLIPCGEVIVYAWMDRRRENSEKPYGTRLRAGLAVSARLVGK